MCAKAYKTYSPYISKQRQRERMRYGVSFPGDVPEFRVTAKDIGSLKDMHEIMGELKPKNPGGSVRSRACWTANYLVRVPGEDAMYIGRKGTSPIVADPEEAYAGLRKDGVYSLKPGALRRIKGHDDVLRVPYKGICRGDGGFGIRFLEPDTDEWREAKAHPEGSPREQLNDSGWLLGGNRNQRAVARALLAGESGLADSVKTTFFAGSGGAPWGLGGLNGISFHLLSNKSLKEYPGPVAVPFFFHLSIDTMTDTVDLSFFSISAKPAGLYVPEPL